MTEKQGVLLITLALLLDYSSINNIDDKKLYNVEVIVCQ